MSTENTASIDELPDELERAPTPFPYPVGTKVRGANCIGIAFEETVTEIVGPFTVKLDGLYVTPVSLIHEVISVAPVQTGENYSDPIPDEAPAPADQLSLF